MLVVCCGMPRSGSTLQYNLVRSLLRQTGKGQDQGFFLPDEQSLQAPQLNIWLNDSAFHAIKAHELSNELAALTSSDRAFFLWSERDLLQVAASAIRSSGQGIPQILTSLDEALKTHEKASQARNFISQEYTLLDEEPLTAVQQIVSMLNFDTSSISIESILDENDKTKSYQRLQDSQRSLPVRLKRLVLKIGKSLRLPAMARSLGTSNKLIEKVSQWLRHVDGNTLLHLDHISKDSGSDLSLLTEQDRRTILERYKDWINAHQSHPADHAY